MKNLKSFVTLLIFILSTTNYVSSAEAKEEIPDPVLDIEGDDLRVGETYFMISAIWGAGGGGVAAKPLPNTTCEFAVAQEGLDLLRGDPLTLSPANSENGDVIRESTDLNIMFSLRIACRPSTVWRVDEYDESTKQNFLMIGGVAGNPGSETVNNWFKIEKVGPIGYKLVYCPTVCDFCTVSCSDVGLYFGDGLRRLALRDQPFWFVFQKVKQEHHKY